MGQSPTWGHPAPQVRLEIQFTGLVGRVKFEGPPHPRGRNIVSQKVQLGGSTCAPITFWFVDQSSPNFFRLIGDEMMLIQYFSHFSCVDPFVRYLRSKSKVVTNHAKFWKFFTLPNFVGAPLAKLVSTISPRLQATSRGKISRGYAHYSQSYRRAYVEL